MKLIGSVTVDVFIVIPITIKVISIQHIFIKREQKFTSYCTKSPHIHSFAR